MTKCILSLLFKFCHHSDLHYLQMKGCAVWKCKQENKKKKSSKSDISGREKGRRHFEWRPFTSLSSIYFRMSLTKKINEFLAIASAARD